MNVRKRKIFGPEEPVVRIVRLDKEWHDMSTPEEKRVYQVEFENLTGTLDQLNSYLAAEKGYDRFTYHLTDKRGQRHIRVVLK